MTIGAHVLTKLSERKAICFELSRAEVDRLIIQELQRRHPGALPVTVDYEARTEGGFCHCWWVPKE